MYSITKKLQVKVSLKVFLKSARYTMTRSHLVH